MTDETEFGRLPWFSRDIAVLSKLGSNHGASVRDYGVLSPFSGVLETRVERGRAPMLDLSYLTLEPLVASELPRPAGRKTETVRQSDVAPDAETDEGRERTVREVIHDESGNRTDEGTLDTGRLSSGVEGPSLTRLSVGSERPDSRPDTPRGETRDQSSNLTSPDRDTPGNAPRDWSSETTDGRSEAPNRTTVDRSRSTDAATRQGRDEPSDLGGAGSADPSSMADSAARSVIDRSETSFESADRRADTGPPSPDDSATRSGEIPPPRMVTEDATREAAGRSSNRSGSGERAPRASDWSSPRETAGPMGTARTAAGRTDQGTTDGPRMVVDRTDAGGRGDDDSASVAGVDDRSEPPSSDGRDLNDRTVDNGEPVATIRKASGDPESELIDRLYRTLREREAIERRRRGGR